jgi:type IV pilus assembly protein PilA
MKKMNNKGFSLIELIIVIAIMAILVAIIAPNLTKYLGKSKKNTDKKNADEIASQVQTTITDYETDEGSIFQGTHESGTVNWSGKTASDSSTNVFATGFIDLLNKNITSSTKSKEKNTEATCTITKSTSGDGYTITVEVGSQTAIK